MRANQIIWITSIIGIVPLKICKWAIGGAAKAMVLFFLFFNLPDRETAMENVKYLTGTVIWCNVYSIRSSENFIFKIGRKMTESDKKYWDVWDEMYGTFEIQVGEKEKNYKISFNNKTILQGSLFKLKTKNGKKK